MPRAPLRGVYRASVLLVATLSVAAAAQLEQIDDAAARMQYAYYTADTQALQAGIDLLSAHEDAALEPLRSYYLAYGQWRLADLYARTQSAAGADSADKAASARAARSCTQYAQAALEKDARFAEAYALLAICERVGSTLKLGCRAKPLRRAADLAPNNPRVRLITAMCSEGVENPEAMRAVAAQFESAALKTGSGPEWGHAEALTLLGASCLQRGDALAARDALERALVIAPDYREAQQLLHAAAARPN